MVPKQLTFEITEYLKFFLRSTEVMEGYQSFAILEFRSVFILIYTLMLKGNV